MQASLAAARPAPTALPTRPRQPASALGCAPWQRCCIRSARARTSAGAAGEAVERGGGSPPEQQPEFKEEDWPHIKWALQMARAEDEAFCEQPEITVRLADAGFYMSYDESFMRPVTVRATDGQHITYRDLRATLEAERAPDVGHCRLEGVEPLSETEYIARFEQTPQ